MKMHFLVALCKLGDGAVFSLCVAEEIFGSGEAYRIALKDSSDLAY